MNTTTSLLPLGFDLGNIQLEKDSIKDVYRVVHTKNGLQLLSDGLILFWEYLQKNKTKDEAMNWCLERGVDYQTLYLELIDLEVLVPVDNIVKYDFSNSRAIRVGKGIGFVDYGQFVILNEFGQSEMVSQDAYLLWMSSDGNSDLIEIIDTLNSIYPDKDMMDARRASMLYYSLYDAGLLRFVDLND